MTDPRASGWTRSDAILDAIYKALKRFDQEERSVRNLRMAMGGKGPTIRRGTRRIALARLLTDAALTAIREWESEP